MYSLKNQNSKFHPRRGAILVLAAIMMVMVFGFVAFTVDLGYLTVMKTELQSTADAAALGAVQELAIGATEARAMAKTMSLQNRVANSPVTLNDADIEIGVYNEATGSFTIQNNGANAVHVTARKLDYPTFFGPVIGHNTMSAQADATAVMTPRDIVFVVDLSGSMNDDTEPCWATSTIDSEFASQGYPNAGSGLIQDLYDDLGFGIYPGTYEYIGAPLGLAANKYAYALMTVDNGPLTNSALGPAYLIDNSDSEQVRKRKAYSWIIDYQIANIMPNATPAPDSATNYGYWEKYIDYLIVGTRVGDPPPPGPPKPPKPPGPPGPPPPPPPPKPPIGKIDLPDWAQSVAWNDLKLIPGLLSGNWSETIQAPVLLATPPIGTPRQGSTKQVWIPPRQDGDRIYKFNNPNKYTFPSASGSLPHQWRNKIGYITYTQFMLDWGRDRTPDHPNSSNSNPALGGKVPLSRANPLCRYHSESTAGGTFDFPPRTQPMHSVRRSLIAAIKVVKDMNSGLTAGTGDRVAIVTYDGLDAFHKAEIVMPLTGDYKAAMTACTTLQATSDIGTTTAMEAGLITARDHIKPASEGGSGREFTDKVVLLLTDGVPNAWQSTTADINGFISSNPDPDFYDSAYPWLNSVLMQTAQFYGDDGVLYPVGMGAGTDYGFMDRIARMAFTDSNGQSARGSGNPMEYEQRLTDIFEEIIKRPSSRLVE